MLTSRPVTGESRAATHDLPLSSRLQPFADDGNGHFRIVADHRLNQVSII